MRREYEVHRLTWSSVGIILTKSLSNAVNRTSYDCGCGPDPSASTNDKAATPAKAANLAGAPGVAGAPLRPHRRGSRRRGDTDHRYDGEAAAAEEQMDESPLDAFFGGMSQPVVERDAAVRQCGLCTVRP